jgi:glycosyltransferase involved in cell wall biosynthesis
MQVAVFHPGTQHSWQTASALDQLGLLEWYATSIFYKPDSLPYSLERVIPGALGRRLHAEFRRFSHPGLDPAKVRTVGLVEWLERLAGRAGMRRLARALDAHGNRRFVAHLARDLASPREFALWGYSGSSAASFAAAREHGRLCILDRTIGDFRAYNRAMEPVRESHGEWFLPSSGPIAVAQIEADQREYELADVILAGSRFAAETVQAEGGAGIADKVRVLPYCFDEALFGSQPAPVPIGRDEPVRFLFVGQVHPRKGIHHLLEAFARLPLDQASLTVVGDLGVPKTVFARHADRVRYLPTVARADIPPIMAAHNVLVFPSYFEGSALSLLEALASGMAIIQTPSSGNGVTPETGIMLDRPDTDLLHQAMLTAITDRDRLNAWRLAAQPEARRYSFARYRENIAALLAEF